VWEDATVGAAIGSILGEAIGVAISPVPIIAVILMLFSTAAKPNSVAFLVGWIAGLTVVGAIVLATGVASSAGTPSDTSGVVKIVIGVLFIALGVRQWLGRPRDGHEPDVPAWMAAIDDFTVVRAFGVGVLLSAVNPKNLGLTLAAAATIGSSGLTTGEEYLTLAVYVVLASLTIAIPVILNLALGARAEHTLDEMKGWLLENNATIMTVLFVVLGAKVAGSGIAILA
jgi:threonine/homoserine/homoserine lactone efflux protein